MTQDIRREWEIEENEADLKRDAKRRMEQFRKEEGEHDGLIIFIIVLAVALIIGNAVLMWVY